MVRADLRLRVTVDACIDASAERNIFVFFFFQAEDGIRARTVTGVQTCALPISEERAQLAECRHGIVHLDRRPRDGDDQGGRSRAGTPRAGHAPRSRAGRLGRDRSMRSEERRVGEGGGAWRATRDEKTWSEMSGR